MDFKNLDKNQKMVLIILPIFIVGVILVAVFQFNGGSFSASEEETEKSIDLTVEEKNETKTKSRIELYREAQKLKSQDNSNQIGTDDFYDLSEVNEVSYEKTNYDDSHLMGDAPQKKEAEVVTKLKTNTTKRTNTNYSSSSTTVKKQEVVQEPVKQQVQEPVQQVRTRQSGTLGNITNEKQSLTVVAGTESYDVYINNDNKIVKNGNLVTLVFKKEGYINGIKIPGGTNVNASANFSINRVFLTVTQIRVGDKFINTKLEAYEFDGSKGIKVSDEIKDEIKEDVVGDINPSVSVNVPYIGSISTRGANRLKDRNSAILVDRHQLILK